MLQGRHGNDQIVEEPKKEETNDEKRKEEAQWQAEGWKDKWQDAAWGWWWGDWAPTQATSMHGTATWAVKGATQKEAAPKEATPKEAEAAPKEAVAQEALPAEATATEVVAEAAGSAKPNPIASPKAPNSEVGEETDEPGTTDLEVAPAALGE